VSHLSLDIDCIIDFASIGGYQQHRECNKCFEQECLFIASLDRLVALLPSTSPLGIPSVRDSENS